MAAPDADAPIATSIGNGRIPPRLFSNRGAWVKFGVKRWSLPGSWFSPGSVARPMMGVRGVTPRGVKRSDRTYAQSIHSLCAVVRTRRPGKDSASAGAELVWRIARQAAFSRVHQNSVPSVQMQCRMTAILRATAMRAFLAPIRFAKRMPQAFNGENR